MILISIALLAAQAANPTAKPVEERLLAASIADLKRQLPYPRAAEFRRVHLFQAVGMDGSRRTLLCGQVHVDDPRGPPDWTMFGAAETSAGFQQYVGGMATRWCDQPTAEWDYTRDFSSRYQAEVAGMR